MMMKSRAQELVQQITFAAHHLDAVVAGLFRQLRTADVGRDRRFDAALRQRARTERGNRRLLGRARDHQRLVAVASRVQDLQQDLAALLVHGAGDAAVVRHVAQKIERAAEGQQPALPVGRDAPGDDQPDAAARPLAVERRQLAVVVKTVFEPGVHRAHDHAVLQRGEAEVEGSEQVGVGGGGDGCVHKRHYTAFS
jgi:hypothetical protein